MSRIRRPLAIALLMSAAQSLCGVAAAQDSRFVEFMQPLGQSSFQYYIRLRDVSEDGFIAVGSKSNDRPLVWEGGGNAIQLGFEPHPVQWAIANGVSPDGSLIAGGTTASNEMQALLWRDRVVEFLPHPEDDVTTPFSQASDVSANGVVVGTANVNVSGTTRKQAVRWIDGEMEPLPDPPGPVSWTEGLFVSDDGTVIVGRALTGAGYRAVRWSEGSVEMLDTLVPDGSFDPKRINGDASVIVGSAWNGSGSEAVRWEDGRIEGLGFLPGGTKSAAATSLTRQGDLIIGYSVIDPVPTCRPSYSCSGWNEGFVWTPETGMLNFEEWFRYGCGFDVVNWHLAPYTISGDGSTIYFSGTNYYGSVRHFLADVSECGTDYEVPEWKTQPGDYYVSDAGTSAVYRMHRETGELDPLTSFEEIYLPIDLAMGPHGELYVLSKISNRIVRFDPRTGQQSIVSEKGIIYDPERIVVGVDGTLYVINTSTYYAESDGIVRVDPSTGEQTMLAIGGWVQPRGELALGPNGNLLTLSTVGGDWKIIEIDVETGDQSVMTTIQADPSSALDLIAYDPVTDSLRARRYESDVIAIDMQTGSVSVLSTGKIRFDQETGSRGASLTATWGGIFYRTAAETLESKALAESGHLQGVTQIIEILPRCSDQLDNDGDGLVDADDPACISPDNDSEEYRDDVRIDIAPEDPENVISLHRPTPIEVRVFGSDDLDVRSIDGVAFGPNGAPSLFDLDHWLVRLFSSRDWDRDGYQDLTLFFALEETGIALMDDESCLEGYADGVPFRSCDRIEVDMGPSCGNGFAVALVIPMMIGLRHLGTRAGRRSRPSDLS